MVKPEELEGKSIKRELVTNFLKQCGLDLEYVSRAVIDPHGVEVELRAEDEGGNPVWYYYKGSWVPVTHWVSLRIVDDES